MWTRELFPPVHTSRPVNSGESWATTTMESRLPSGAVKT